MSAGYPTVEKTSVSMAPVYSPQQSGRMDIIAPWDLDEDTKAQVLGGFPGAHSQKWLQLSLRSVEVSGTPKSS